jgi:threonyl-tRNA synthetase
MLIVGENEEANGTVSVRRRGEGDLGAMSVEDFINYFKKHSAINNQLSAN